MNIITFTFALAAGSVVAGFLGALTGLGGGVVIVPLLVLVFHVDIRYAMGASLVSVIATSSGAAAAYVKEGFSNIRVGMFLEIATTVGAIAGAHLTTVVPAKALAVIFGGVLLYSAWHSFHQQHAGPQPAEPDGLAVRLKLDGTYPEGDRRIRYHVTRVKAGFSLMFGAGLLSGLLGIGSGAMKVIAMDQVMLIPFKVSTTTSNFMIGVTAAASAGIYLSRGYIEPRLTMPVMLGVLAGSLLGAKLLVGAKPKSLRMVFAAVIAVLAVEMISNGLHGVGK